MDGLIVFVRRGGDETDTIQNIGPTDIEFFEIIGFRNMPFPPGSKSAPVVQILPDAILTRDGSPKCRK